jgi:hypothetical protein
MRVKMEERVSIDMAERYTDHGTPFVAIFVQ